MTVRAILWDLGGVILRTEYQAPREHLAERLNMTYEDLSKVVFASETARLASVGAITTDQHWAAVVERLGRPVAEAKTIREEFFAGDVIDWALVGYLRSVRPRHKTALISNGWPDLREYIVRNHFADAFDVLVISAEAGVMKPEAQIYEAALERLQVKSDQAVFVDDTLANVEAAVALGMRGIHFKDPSQALREVKALLP